MVGCIPIVISSSIDELYNELPVVIVESYDIITESYLNEIYEKLINQTYNFDKLYSTYWLKKISDDILSVVL